MSNSSVGWTGTSFSVDPPVFNAERLKCLIFQREKSPETDRLHWQFACRTKNRNGLSLKTMKDIFPGAHLEPSKGNWEQNVAYCSKLESRAAPEVEPTILGDPPAFGEKLKKRKIDALLPLCEMAMEHKPLKSIIRSDPATYARNYNAINFLHKTFHPDQPNEFVASDFVKPLWDFSGNLVVVFCGPSGIGKTQFARAHFSRPCMITHLDDLRKYDPDLHDGLIFDDLQFTHIPVTAQINLVDSDLDRAIHLRNVNVTIPAKTRKIFTCNPGREPFSYDEAIERRIKTVQYTEKLFIDIREPILLSDDEFDLE